jgi:hypothetical protein
MMLKNGYITHLALILVPVFSLSIFLIFISKPVISDDRLCGLVSEFLATDPEARVRFLALPKKSIGSGTGSTQPREYNRGAT